MMVSGSLSDAEKHPTRKSCIRCKGSKKKCDKALPSCSRCSRLSLDCKYNESTSGLSSSLENKLDEILRRLDKIETKLFQNENSENTEKNEPIPFGIDHARNESAKSSEMQNWQIKPVFLKPSYRAFLCTMDLMRFVEERNLSLVQISHKFFRTIHGWLPIVSERRVLDTFPIIQNGDPNAASTLLIFSMLLLISNPFESDDGLSPTETHLYLTTKYQFSLFLSLSCPSIEMVQAGILIALYEYAQGATDMSYVTIGSCATLAYLLGLHQASHTPSIMTGENQRVDEERNCTWWAIVALDRSSSSTISRLLCVQSIANPYTFRYINMESLSTLRPPAVENPAPEKNLPQQYQPWDDTLHTTDSLPLSDCGSGS
ncbi:hypothetical protein N7520_004231, partial [Penicillium odoratum]|uniref:uncharacterized protein n=1 Tax=Penicillium odoratum TaxID=1167516 RepID=UPI0025465DDC